VKILKGQSEFVNRRTEKYNGQKILKGQSESVNRRTDNTMARRY
jgi:hypothetical protein